MQRVWLTAILTATMLTPAFAQDEQSGFDHPYWLSRSVIEAIGRAESEVTPDRASFTVTYQEVAHNAADASAAAADRARLATAAMRQRGHDVVEIRANISVQANYEQYRDREGVRRDADRADQIDSYTAQVTLEVLVRDANRAATVRAAALAVGPESATDLSYSLRQTTELQRRVYEAAVQDAAARARLSAAAAGAHLGPLLALQEGQGPCLGSWYGERPGMYAPPPPPPPPPLPPSADETVTVTGSRIGGKAPEQLQLTAEQIARLDLPIRQR
ncbi:MAG: SIMPL domain-containing protein [Pseudomonadota bacterium]